MESHVKVAESFEDIAHPYALATTEDGKLSLYKLDEVFRGIRSIKYKRTNGLVVIISPDHNNQLQLPDNWREIVFAVHHPLLTPDQQMNMTLTKMNAALTKLLEDANKEISQLRANNQQLAEQIILVRLDLAAAQAAAAGNGGANGGVQPNNERLMVRNFPNKCTLMGPK